eukprot:s99_g33.t1
MLFILPAEPFSRPRLSISFSSQLIALSTWPILSGISSKRQLPDVFGLSTYVYVLPVHLDLALRASPMQILVSE